MIYKITNLICNFCSRNEGKRAFESHFLSLILIVKGMVIAWAHLFEYILTINV